MRFKVHVFMFTYILYIYILICCELYILYTCVRVGLFIFLSNTINIHVSVPSLHVNVPNSVGFIAQGHKYTFIYRIFIHIFYYRHYYRLHFFLLSFVYFICSSFFWFLTTVMRGSWQAKHTLNAFTFSIQKWLIVHNMIPLKFSIKKSNQNDRQWRKNTWKLIHSTLKPTKSRQNYSIRRWTHLAAYPENLWYLIHSHYGN